MMVIAETVTIIADVFATAADNNHHLYDPILINLINMFYFMAFFARAFVMYRFAAVVLKDRLEGNAIVRNLIRLPLFLGLVLSFLSMLFGSKERPWFIYYVDHDGYHSGLLYNFLYFCAFFYVLLALLSLYLFRASVRRRERYGILAYNLIIVASLVIRISLPKMLIMDTFILIAILGVFLAFENPEYFLDLRGYAFNRIALCEHLNENRRNLKHVPVGIAISHFTEMRDIYGGTQIEEGLCLIARYLKKVYKKGIVFYCRNGRFVVLVNPETDIAGARKKVAERFTGPWKSEEAEVYLSAGFAEYEYLRTVISTETALGALLKSVDMAGASYEQEPLKITEEFLIRSEKENRIRHCIEKAIEDTGFELYLQPIVDSASGKVVGAEALSRVRDEEGKIILPGDFIPVAESSGRINKLGEMVFDSVCRLIREKGLEDLGVEWINVNLSPAQFVRTNLAERFASITEHYGCDPSRVHLEITEGAMIDDHFLQRQIAALTSRGFKCVLDDYGTGYSNLSRLKKCPFINIKIDMSIVWDYCSEPDPILPRMIQSFKDMGFSVTAEGIESSEMAETMKDLGCDYLQGYHYSRPVSANEFVERQKIREV